MDVESIHNPAIQAAINFRMENMRSMDTSKPQENTNIPLIDRVPLPWLREKPDDSIINTSRHELQHAIPVGFGKVKELSVVPSGNVAGYTDFKGFLLTRDDFKKAAAASMVSGKGYNPQGYGSDMMQLALMCASEGVDPRSGVSAYIARASSILSNYPEPLLAKMAEIIPFLKTVSGEELFLVQKRAAWELEQEGKPVDKQMLDLRRSDDNTTVTRIIHTKDEYIIKTEHQGQKDEFTVCRHCFGMDGDHNLQVEHPDNMVKCPVCNGIGVCMEGCPLKNANEGSIAERIQKRTEVIFDGNNPQTTGVFIFPPGSSQSNEQSQNAA